MHGRESAAGNLIQIISQSRQNTLKKVNEELIQMYWQVGEYLSTGSMKVSFGDAYIDTVAEEIQNAFPGIKGFNRRGLYRMKKFYETYADDEFVTTLLSQISWSNHLAIISKARTPEERHFYITLCIKENYSARELSRQIDSGYYERCMLSKEKLLPDPIKGLKENPFLDFYLEALDRQKKKENENPSVGMILCASKDDEVVEYAMSRTLSPMMVAEYQLQLPDKNILQKKLQELINMPLLEDE